MAATALLFLLTTVETETSWQSEKSQERFKFGTFIRWKLFKQSEATKTELLLYLGTESA